MPLCGFNTEMIDGIEVFSKGLFAATLDRGRENGVGDISAVRNELTEIELFVEALKKQFGSEAIQYDNAKAEMIYGVALFAHGLFRATLKETEQETQLARHYGATVRAIGQFLEQLETEHQKLKKLFPADVTMRKAADWIAGHGT